MGKDRKSINILICTREFNTKLTETAVFRDHKWLKIASCVWYSQRYNNILHRVTFYIDKRQISPQNQLSILGEGKFG